MVIGTENKGVVILSKDDVNNTKSLLNRLIQNLSITIDNVDRSTASIITKQSLNATLYNETIKMDLELIKEWLIHISNEHLN